MTDQPKPDPQDGDGLNDLIVFVSSLRQYQINPELRDDILNRIIALPRATSPTPDAAEGAGDLLLAVRLRDKEGPPLPQMIAQRRAQLLVVPPKPAPDAVRKAAKPFACLGGSPSASDINAGVHFNAFWDLPADTVIYDDKMGNCFTAGDIRELRRTLSAPVPSPDGAEPVAWQNIDRIIDVLEAAGCCRNGQVISSEDHVANTIRNWLRSLSVQSSNK